MYIRLYLEIPPVRGDDDNLRSLLSVRGNNHNTMILIVIIESLPRVHPVSITRFSIARFSPGSGLLRNPFVS